MVNDSIIREILALSGPLPDAGAHRRWLETLLETRLQARLVALRESAGRRTGGGQWERPAHRQLRPATARDARYDMGVLTR